MKTKLKTIIFALVMLGIIFISSKVQAASASISATKTTATVGDSVTITVNINAATWNLRTSGTGISGGKIVGYDPDGNNTSTTKTYSLNTSSAGSYTISLSGDVTDGTTGVTSDINTSVTVTVNNPAPVTPVTPSENNNNNNNNGGSTNNGNSGNSNSGSNNKPSTPTKPEEPKSNDSTLKGLEIEGYELYPVFDTNTREYNLRVTNDITKVTVVPTVNYSKASCKIEGTTEELAVGKNVITVVVTAEDGTTSNYVINVTREREGLNVQYIKVYYTDEDGNRQELLLNQEFSTEIFEYTLNDISYLISKLDVEVLANLEQAKIEIVGNEKLSEGANTIIVTVTMPSESEEEEDEVLTYKITVNKEKKPVVTLMGRIKNWFKGITGTVSNWFGENVYEILMGALIVSCVALAGLSAYLVMDYKKYKMIIEKVAEITRINNANTNTVNTTETTNQQILEKMQNNEKEEIETKSKGRHF